MATEQQDNLDIYSEIFNGNFFKFYPDPKFKIGDRVVSKTEITQDMQGVVIGIDFGPLQKTWRYLVLFFVNNIPCPLNLAEDTLQQQEKI